MPNPRLVQACDQLGAVLADIAPLLRSYHAALLAQGFTSEEALPLVAGVQEHLLRLAGEQRGFRKERP